MEEKRGVVLAHHSICMCTTRASHANHCMNRKGVNKISITECMLARYRFVGTCKPCTSPSRSKIALQANSRLNAALGRLRPVSVAPRNKGENLGLGHCY